jgi:hypothetical protein
MAKEKEFTEMHCEIVRAIFNVSRQNEGISAKGVMKHLKALFPNASKKDFQLSTSLIEGISR